MSSPSRSGRLFRATMHRSAAELPYEGTMPSLDGATGWLNSPPLTTPELRGRVVLVVFWTYTCINWLRTLSHVRAWAEKYADHGLVVLGVHTPEFDFEHDHENIRRALTYLRVDHPVAIDDDYAVWSAFGNHYWPAFYFVDADGAIRHHRFGEGEYDQSEMVLQRLLVAAGATDHEHELTEAEGEGLEAAADWEDLRSPESYLGSERADAFASPEAALDARHGYTVPERLRLNTWALAGTWRVAPHAAVVEEPDGRIAYRFQARDVHMVLAPPDGGTGARFRVRLDGEAPGAAHGTDIDDRGEGTVTEPRLYQLIRQPEPIVERTFEITFLDPGAQAYAFTFG
jgi:thiol-disulfide isomerase/thioredoxin